MIIEICGHFCNGVLQQRTCAQYAWRVSRRSSISRCTWWSTAVRSLSSVRSAITHSTARTSWRDICWSMTLSNATSAHCELAPVIPLQLSVSVTHSI